MRSWDDADHDVGALNDFLKGSEMIKLPGIAGFFTPENIPHVDVGDWRKQPNVGKYTIIEPYGLILPTYVGIIS